MSFSMSMTPTQRSHRRLRTTPNHTQYELGSKSARKRVVPPSVRISASGIPPYGAEGLRDSFSKLGLSLEENDVRRLRRVGGAQTLSSIISLGQMVGTQEEPTTGKSQVSRILAPHQHTGPDSIRETLLQPNEMRKHTTKQRFAYSSSQSDSSPKYTSTKNDSFTTRQEDTNRQEDTTGLRSSNHRTDETKSSHSKQKKKNMSRKGPSNPLVGDVLRRISRTVSSTKETTGWRHLFLHHAHPGHDGYASSIDVQKGLKEAIGNDADKYNTVVSNIIKFADPQKTGIINYTNFVNAMRSISDTDTLEQSNLGSNQDPTAFQSDKNYATTDVTHKNHATTDVTHKNHATTEEGKNTLNTENGTLFNPTNPPKDSTTSNTSYPSQQKRNGKATVTFGTSSQYGPDMHHALERKRYLDSIKEQVGDKVSSLYGSDPSGTRKLFLRCKRSADGTTSIGDVTNTFRQLGSNVQIKDMVQLFNHENISSKDSYTSDTRLPYQAFAEMIQHSYQTRADNSSCSTKNTITNISNEKPSKKHTTMKSSHTMEHPFKPQSTYQKDIVTRVRRKLDEVSMRPSETFLRVDVCRDGVLTHEEVVDGLHRLGISLTKDEGTNLLQCLDPKDSGAVNYATFVRGLFPRHTDSQTLTILPNGQEKKKNTNQNVSGQNNTSQEHNSSEQNNTSEQNISSTAWELRRANDKAGILGSPTKSRSMTEATPTSVRTRGSQHEFVDEAGVYTTNRDLDFTKTSASDRLQSFLHPERPYLPTNAVLRDIYGTPAPFLEHTGDGHTKDKKDNKTPNPNADYIAPDLVRQKKANDVVRRIMTALGNRSSARKLFLKLNANRDSKVDATELRTGLAKFGAAMTDDEFDCFMGRIDADDNGSISYSEFARSLKEDDPAPDLNDAPLTHSGHVPHRYQPPINASSLPGQGHPRVSNDSRAIYHSLMGQGAAPSRSLETAYHANNLIDRLSRRTGGLRRAYMQLFGTMDRNSSTTINADEVRSRLAKLGVTASKRSVESLLAPLDDTTHHIDYTTFTKLCKPRAYLDMDALDTKWSRQSNNQQEVSEQDENAFYIGRGNIGGAGAGVGVRVPRMGDTEGEGLGRFGSPPPKSSNHTDTDHQDDLPASSTAFVDSANVNIDEGLDNDSDSVAENAHMSSLRRAVLAEQGDLLPAGRQPIRKSRKAVAVYNAAKCYRDTVKDLLTDGHQKTYITPHTSHVYHIEQTETQEKPSLVTDTVPQPLETASKSSNTKIISHSVKPPIPPYHRTFNEQGADIVVPIKTKIDTSHMTQMSRTIQAPVAPSTTTSTSNWQRHYSSSLFSNLEYPT